MNIDWKARLRNKTFWVAIISAIALLTQQLGINIFPTNWSDILNTVLTIFIVLGVIVDTSTKGMGDSTINIASPNISGQSEEIKTEATTTSINGNITENSENK